MTQHPDTAVIVLAAGAGTRMRSETPKVLHTLAGRTMLAHALHSVAKLAPQHLVVVLGHDRDKIAPAVAELSNELARSIEVAVQEEQLGTGHATACGLDALPAGFDGIVVVTSGDIPLLDADTLADLVATHRTKPTAVTVLTTTLPDPSGYGRILRTQDHEVIAIVEQADATASQRHIREVNAGVYAFDLAPLRSALSRLREDNAQHERYLTDVLSITRGDGLTVHAKHVDDAALVAGVNDRVQLSALTAELNARIVASHQLAGVTVIDPSTTWIDIDVTIGRDTVIRPGSQLLGRTRIGARCAIGPDTTLADVTVGDNASVVRTHASSASIGDRADIGPFTFLRPGTVLGADAKLGAFVETKNATIGTGSKVPHLTYVGDADIGEHSNIGASSVFVNYDGQAKHRTRVGSHVRTGSDTMFVAPVTIGDGAYTGAGTVIREDVPPGALAVSAGQQRNIEGWVARNRPGSASAAAAAASSPAPSSPAPSSPAPPPSGPDEPHADDPATS